MECPPNLDVEHSSDYDDLIQDRQPLRHTHTHPHPHLLNLRETGSPEIYPMRGVTPNRYIQKIRGVMHRLRKPSNVIKMSATRRTVITLLLIFAFVALVPFGKPVYIALVLLAQPVVFSEIISLGHRCAREQNIAFYRSISWYFFVCSFFYIYGKSFVEVWTSNRIVEMQVRSKMIQPILKFVDLHILDILRYHSFTSFSMYAIGMILFILTLKKGHYRLQFGQLALTHMAILLVVFQGRFMISNIYNGPFWFIFPVSLVIVNDSFAYVSGILFGKTPLISVSPKKTWEGFIGGTIMTLLSSFIFTKVYSHFEMFRTPPSLFSIKHVTYTFSVLRYSIPIKIEMAYVHSLALAVFASLIAPFGGFLASGFKRAFKAKDFGNVIPGQGGITDRVDCHIVMGLFTYIYYITFVRPTLNDADNIVSIYDLILSQLSPRDILLLYIKLQAYLDSMRMLYDGNGIPMHIIPIRNF